MRSTLIAQGARNVCYSNAVPRFARWKAYGQLTMIWLNPSSVGDDLLRATYRTFDYNLPIIDNRSVTIPIFQIRMATRYPDSHGV
jgi:hypothetical protein